MFDRETLKAFVISLIAAVIFFVVIQPLLTLSASAVPRLIGHISSCLSDGLYAHAAEGPRDYAAFLIETLTISMCLGGAIYFILVLLQLPRLPPEDPDGLKRKRRLRRLALANVASSSIIFLLIAIVLFVDTFEHELNRSFQRRLTVLTAHIEPIQEKTFRARFATMTSKRDYDEMNRAMDALAESKGAKLPRPY